MKNSLKGSKSKEEANQIYADAKMRLMSGAGKEDGSILFLMPVIDNAFSQYIKQGDFDKNKTDFLA